MRLKLLLPVITALLCLTACDVSDLEGFGHYSRDFHYSYPLRAGGRLSIESFNGTVEITAWEKETIDISGSKFGRTPQVAEDLKIDIVQSADSVSIRVVRPYERRSSSGARFVIKAPRGVVLDRIITSNGGIHTTDGVGPARLKTSNGSISVQRLRGSLEAQTSNSSVELTDVEGDVVAHTSNGRIRAERLNGNLEAVTSNNSVFAQLVGAAKGVRVESSNGPVELTLPEGFDHGVHVNTNNSSITLRLPAALNAHILARTSNSSINTDYDVSVRGEVSRQQMDAVIGAGGPLIDLSTSNGPIRLLKM